MYSFVSLIYGRGGGYTIASTQCCVACREGAEKVDDNADTGVRESYSHVCGG